MGSGEWGVGNGEWGLGFKPQPNLEIISFPVASRQSPVTSPQSPLLAAIFIFSPRVAKSRSKGYMCLISR
ncbi:MAG: hypothetical protein DSM106950_22025 [Stigonema ocellatum SAG 48.90 = DSM 106950]|nr:hypothetical protein [Stigonema ocellatum SAG 48.90 = DSM 106950]